MRVGQLPDVYATITEAEPAVVEGLVDILELKRELKRSRIDVRLDG